MIHVRRLYHRILPRPQLSRIHVGGSRRETRESARADYKSGKLEPKNAAYVDSLGWVLFKLNQNEQALEYLLKAVELSEVPDAAVYDHVGDVYRALKQNEKAREAWKNL